MRHLRRERALSMENAVWSFLALNLGFLVAALWAYKSEQDNGVLAAAKKKPVVPEVKLAPAEIVVDTRPLPRILKLKPASHNIYVPAKRRPAREPKVEAVQIEPEIQVVSAESATAERPASSSMQRVSAESVATERPASSNLPRVSAESVATETPAPASLLAKTEALAALKYPTYEIVHASLVGGDHRKYAEIMINGLTPKTPTSELRRVAKGIAELEDLDSLVIYCNNEARMAHYSMSYADENPDALKDGLLCYIERGWFKRAGPKEWGLSKR